MGIALKISPRGNLISRKCFDKNLNKLISIYYQTSLDTVKFSLNWFRQQITLKSLNFNEIICGNSLIEKFPQGNIWHGHGNPSQYTNETEKHLFEHFEDCLHDTQNRSIIMIFCMSWWLIEANIFFTNIFQVIQIILDEVRVCNGPLYQIFRTLFEENFLRIHETEN